MSDPIELKEIQSTEIITVDKNGQSRRRHLTEKQLKAFQYRAQGYNIRQSLLRAGYSVKVANQGKKALMTKGMIEVTNQLKDSLLAKGIDFDYMADKLKAFIESDNENVGLSAWKEAKQELIPKGGTNPTKRITYEEFVGGDTE